MCVGLAIYLAGSRYLPRDEVPETPAPAPAVAEAPGEPSPMRLLVATALAVIVFRGAYEQSGNAMALWIDTGVDRALAGWVIPATWFQSLNPLFVFMLTPIVVAFWNRDRSGRAYRPAALRRMSLGALGVGLSYLLLGAVIAAAGASSVHWAIVVAFFLLYTLAEIYILPVGLSLFATLSPSRFTATTIAAWFLASFAGNFLAGYVGTWWSAMSPAAFFGAIGLISAGAGVALASLSALQQKAARPAPAAAPYSRRT
jgi:POT family proton-dependent oligopeptide transporter